jgi:hypothetical protein
MHCLFFSFGNFGHFVAPFERNTFMAMVLLVASIMISILYGSPEAGLPNNWAAIVG